MKVTGPPALGSGSRMACALGEAMPDLDGLTDAELREFLVDMDRVANSAHACSAEAMAEMARRATAADSAEAVASGRPLMPHEQRWEFVADEVAVVLAITKMDAARRYGLALAASAL